MDKEFLGIIYPETAQPCILKLMILAPAMERKIGKDGAEDMFELIVNVLGQYAIETGGSTDVVKRFLVPATLGFAIGCQLKLGSVISWFDPTQAKTFWDQ